MAEPGLSTEYLGLCFVHGPGNPIINSGLIGQYYLKKHKL